MKKPNFKIIGIKKIEFTTHETEMCDLEVKKYENFILANGVITHNSANIEVNTIRQVDYLILKKASLLQLDFERKKIQDIYTEAKQGFEKHGEKIGLAYIYAHNYKGFVANSLPSFWSTDLSKSYRIK